MENNCNYSDEWQPYIGDYDKFEYDIKTKMGEVVENCYPNAGKFTSMVTDDMVMEEFVEEIRFSHKPRTVLNRDVSPRCTEWLLSEEGKAQDMYQVNDPEETSHHSGQVFGRLLGYASLLAPMCEMPAMIYTDYNAVPKKHFKRGGKVEQVRTEPKHDRNAPCSCGSGKKFKKCCITKTETK